MDYDFNADEVFEMAEQIERNGAKFYRKSAEEVKDASAAKLLLDLAAMEDEHEKTFSQLRLELSDKEKEKAIFDPNNETVLYLKALADMRVFYQKEIDLSSLEEILKAAVTAEKDSIVFYLGVMDLVPDERGKKKLDLIIHEEMNHIHILSKHLKACRK